MKAAPVIGAALIGFLAGGATVLWCQQRAAQTQRFPQFENDAVKVWRTVVAPNSPGDLHRHDHPRVIVALSGGTMKTAAPDGKTETNVWETGKAYWGAAMPPGAMHRDVNAGTKPIEVMVVELKHEQ